MRKPRWSPRLAAALIVVGGSSVLALVGAELVLRVWFPQVFEVHPRGMYAEHPTIGYVLKPSFNGEIRRPEFRIQVSTNSSGYRGEELEDRGEGAIRIVALGDSFTWGFGVEAAEAWPALLQEGVAERTGRKVQVVNGGVPGYSTVEALELLRERGARLRPDLVVLQFLPDNDFLGNRFPAREHWEIRGGRLVDRSSERPFLVRAQWFLKNNSHVAALLSDRLGHLAMRLGMLQSVTGGMAEQFTGADSALAVSLIGELADAARNSGAELLVVFSPSQAPVLAPDRRASRAEGVIANAAREAGASLVVLTPLLRASPDRGSIYYPLDGHWTRFGNRVVGEIVSDSVAAILARRGERSGPDQDRGGRGSGAGGTIDTGLR